MGKNDVASPLEHGLLTASPACADVALFNHRAVHLTAALPADFLTILRTLYSLQRHETLKCLNRCHGGDDSCRVQAVVAPGRRSR